MQYPSAQHWLGTDNFGRDILSRVIYGGRISLLVAVMAVAIALISGSLLGATAAYFGGVYETVVMRAMDDHHGHSRVPAGSVHLHLFGRRCVADRPGHLHRSDPVLRADHAGHGTHH